MDTKRGLAGKRAIIGLVERGGQVRTFHVAVADKASVAKIVTDNVAKETYLHTDESRLYGDADQLFAEHHTVKHSVGEYVRYEADRAVHTNTIEGVFSIFKAGCVASISTVTKSICIGTLPSSTSGTTTGWRSAMTTHSVRQP